MKYRNFNEFLDAKAKVDISGDTAKPGPTKPPKEHGNKPYANSDGKKVSNKESQGFGDQGDKDLVFNYDIKGKGKDPAKIPTVEFAHYQLLPLIRESVESNPLLTEQIVRELKRGGLLPVLVAEMLQHSETYNTIAEVMGHKEYGPLVCRKLARAMREEVSPGAYHAAGEEDEDIEDVDFENGDQSDEEGIDDGLLDDEDSMLDDEDEDMLGDDELGDEDMLGDDEDMLGLGGDNIGLEGNPDMGEVPNPLMQKKPMPPAMQNFQRAMMRAW